jgi:hypothetical protein
MGFNKGGEVMLVRDVRRVRLNFVFVIHKSRTAGNVGKKCKKVIFDCHSY